uniref:Uncharacterized protein n=1 Tax=Anguilla anguilla TaxID=7936 RepID=A0A0E9VE43_ANGAN
MMGLELPTINTDMAYRLVINWLTLWTWLSDTVYQLPQLYHQGDS